MIGFSCQRQATIEGTLKPAKGGKNYGGVFRVNENGEMRGLDPVTINDVTSHHISQQIYDNLLTFDEHLRLEPQIAHSWNVSTDGTVYTFYLRNDVYFHDNACFAGGKGRRVTAKDVEYSLTRCFDARAKTRSFDFFRGKVIGGDAFYEATSESVKNGTTPAVASVKGLVVLNDTTFQIRLTKAFAPFENYVAMGFGAIIPHEAVEKYGEDYFQHPVGSGPFVFKEWVPDQHLIVERNPKYWDKDEFGNQLPLIDKVRFSFIKDDKIQLLEFREGNLEESYRIPNEFFQDIVDEKKQLKGDYTRFNLFAIPALSTQYYGMLNTHPVFKDVRVRKAFSLAVDRERINRYVLKNQAAEAGNHGLVPPPVPGYRHDSIQGFPFDIAKARAYLAEAGFPGGKGFPSVTLQLNAGGGRNSSVAEAVQSMLNENLGINVQLKQVEFASHLNEVDEGKAAFFRLGWVADYPDPETFLNLFYGKNVPKDGGISPINQVRFMDKRFDELFEKAISTPNYDERMRIYEQAEQLAMSQAPMIILFHDEDYRLVQKYVQDYRNDAMDHRHYRFVWFKP